jgi:hypothetical protein
MAQDAPKWIGINVFNIPQSADEDDFMEYLSTTLNVDRTDVKRIYFRFDVDKGTHTGEGFLTLAAPIAKKLIEMKTVLFWRNIVRIKKDSDQSRAQSADKGMFIYSRQI